MDLYNGEIRDKYYNSKRRLKRLLNELQTADDIIQVSHIHLAIDDIICDLASYKINDINYYRDLRAGLDAFYMKAALLGRGETDGKKA